MQARNVYRPTEDSSGRHRQLLTALADAALHHAKRMMQQHLPSTDSAQNRQHELVAVCDVLSAILAVEHRAVQPHLSDIWQLLWLAAEGGTCLLAPCIHLNILIKTAFALD